MLEGKSEEEFAQRMVFIYKKHFSKLETREQRYVRNLEHSHDDSQTFGHPKSHTLGQPAKGQS